MGLSAAAKERRKGRITASVLAACLGMDPYRSPRQAWEDIMQERPDDAGAAAMLGSCLEDGVLHGFELSTGIRVARRNIWRVSEDGLICATLDAETGGRVDPSLCREWQRGMWETFAPYADEEAAVEGKTSGLFGRIPLTEWGEPNTDQVPRRVLIQAHAQMYAAPEKRRVFVPALLAGRGLLIFRVERDEEFLRILQDRAMRFKVDYLDTRKPPPPTYLDEEALRAVQRREGACASVNPALVRAWREARERRLAAEKEEAAAFAALLDAGGDAEIFDGGAEGVVTFLRNKPSRRLDTTALRAAHPDLCEQFTKEVPGARVPRWKKPAAAEVAA